MVKLNYVLYMCVKWLPADAVWLQLTGLTTCWHQAQKEKSINQSCQQILSNSPSLTVDSVSSDLMQLLTMNVNTRACVCVGVCVYTFNELHNDSTLNAPIYEP